MNITIIGAGAIGGVIGAYLTRGGEDVTLVDVAEEHVQALRAKGLTILEKDTSFTVPVRALTMDELAAASAPLDIVFLCVKAQHTESAISAIEHLLTPRSAIVSFQIELCEHRIVQLVGEDRTIGCEVNLFADYLEPGVIQYGGEGSVCIGELNGEMTPRVLEIVQVLKSWGKARATSNIWGYLWGKLSYGTVLTATAITNETIADIIESEKYRRLLVDLAAEALAVAEHQGVIPEGFDDWEPSLLYPLEQRNWDRIDAQMESLVQRLRSYTKTRTGIWRDLAVRKRKTEVADNFMPVIEMGHAAGLATPLMEALLTIIVEIENGQRDIDIANLNELLLVHEQHSQRA